MSWKLLASLATLAFATLAFAASASAQDLRPGDVRPELPSPAPSPEEDPRRLDLPPVPTPSHEDALSAGLGVREVVWSS